MGLEKKYEYEGNKYISIGIVAIYGYIDVMKLIDKYRNTVNPKVNVFCVQTAGYDNVLIPEYTYRGAVLYGWTGKESLFASKIIEQWEDIENNKGN